MQTQTTEKPVVAIIIGSGASVFQLNTIKAELSNRALHVQNIDLVHLNELATSSPYGRPEGRFLVVDCTEGVVLFFSRHGEMHLHPPSAVNWRGNMWWLKNLGATHILATTAVGSLCGDAQPGSMDDIPPGTIMILNQYIDMGGVGVAGSFFRRGPAVHVAMADPTCPCQDRLVLSKARERDLSIFGGGAVTCVIIPGPEFSTRAEGHLYYSMGARAIGMSFSREAILARAACVHYTSVGMVTDRNCGHAPGEEVCAEQVVTALPAMIQAVTPVLLDVAAQIMHDAASEWTCGCRHALRGAIQTPIEALSEKDRRLLELLQR